jgi:EAL domain-containing protein (putative c-di-GMP-specific phosphodiesterase class I)
MPDICVAVNLSARQFQKADLAVQIASILEEIGIDPSRLGLEIAESVAMGNLERTIPAITSLAGMGIEIGIDAFGTGYSSLSCLKKLPLHKLKIDRSFIKGISTDADDRTIIKAVTALAQSMNLRVVAEGVATDEQHEFLRAIGCQELQGELFSRPLPAAAMAELITSRKFEEVCES